MEIATLSKKLNKIIEKCENAKVHLKKQNMQIGKIMKKNEDVKSDNEMLFSKSREFLNEKNQVKENVRKHLEKQKEDKFRKIKSVLLGEIASQSNLVSPEDLQNNEAAKFFSLNKRAFGEGFSRSGLVYEKSLSKGRISLLVNPIETVLSGIQTILTPPSKRLVLNSERSVFANIHMKEFSNSQTKNSLAQRRSKLPNQNKGFYKLKNQKLLQLGQIQKSILMSNRLKLSPNSKSLKKLEYFLLNSK